MGRNLGCWEDQRILLVGVLKTHPRSVTQGTCTKYTLMIPTHRVRPGWVLQKFPNCSGTHPA